MDRDALDRRLAEAFGGEPSDARRASSDVPSDGGEPGERRAVVRQALDLADAGRWAETHGGERLTVDRVVGELEQAPSDRKSDEARGASRRSPPSDRRPDEGLADRWNWWIGALEVAHGGFEPFAVRAWRAE